MSQFRKLHSHSLRITEPHSVTVVISHINEKRLFLHQIMRTDDQMPPHTSYIHQNPPDACHQF